MPVSIVWGEEDPWEKVEWGRQLAKHASVQVGRGGAGWVSGPACSLCLCRGVGWGGCLAQRAECASAATAARAHVHGLTLTTAVLVCWRPPAPCNSLLHFDAHVPAGPRHCSYKAMALLMPAPSWPPAIPFCRSMCSCLAWAIAPR